MKKNVKPLALNKETLRLLALKKGEVLGEVGMPVTVDDSCDDE